jgi:tRNA-binding EMAP/Myf-like protein
MNPEAESGNVPFTSAASGSNSNDSLQNVVAAVEQSTAVKNAKKLHGCTIVIGATALHDFSFLAFFFSQSSNVLFQ